MKEVDCRCNSVSCLFVTKKSTFYEMNVSFREKTGSVICEKISGSYQVNIFIPMKFARISNVQITLSLVFMQHVVSVLD